jgi:hypothetical protein
MEGMNAVFRISALWSILFNLLALQATVGAQITLEWDSPTYNTDGSTLSSLTLYKVYYGSRSHVYEHVVTVTDATRATISNLVGNCRYFFSVTACNSDNSESPFADEIVWDAPLLDQPSRIRAIAGEGDAPAGLTVSWYVQGGKTYRVEMSADLIAWEQAPSGDEPVEQSIVAPLTDGVLSYRDVTAGDASQRFYRIRLIAP